MPLNHVGGSETTTLTAVARAKMERVFAGGHRPSENQWAAITDYLQHVEDAAKGELQPAVYLSAIPAGTGKSVAVAAVTGAMATIPAYEETGALIAVNRLSEARDMADALAEHRGSLCMVVGRNAEREMTLLGDHADADAAQIVVTTQAALKETLRRGQDFATASRYFYRGERRRVILWDEAISFNRPVVLDSDAVLKLAGALRRQSPAAVATLLQWAANLAGLPAGVCPVPDFVGLGVDFARLEQEAGDDDQAAQARALATMSGERGYIRRSNAEASSLISYVPELPRSLMPVLVTDASAARGVHHGSYEQMANNRTIKQLKEAEKTYRNLTIRVIPTSASRSTYRKPGSFEGRDLINMIVDYVRRVTPEDVLVVGYKSSMAIHGVQERTIAAAVDARLTPEERGRCKHLSWGNHTATNAYKNVRHVVFAGLYFRPETAAYAASGAALEKPMNTADAGDHPSDAQVKEMERGMLRDSTLQAILRGAARMGVDGDCGVQEVILPQSPQRGLSVADLQAMFPGCRIATDLSLMPLKPLTGNLLRLAEAVQRRQEVGDTEVTDPSLYGELGIGRADYGRLKKRPKWAAWVTRSGWHMARLTGGIMGLRRAM